MAQAAKKAAAKKAAAKKAPAPTPKVVVVRTGEVKEIDFTKGMTVADALKKAGYTFKTAEEVRVNNKKVTNSQLALKAGDQLMIIGQIAGA